jgi:hypothetical protein
MAKKNLAQVRRFTKNSDLKIVLASPYGDDTAAILNAFRNLKIDLSLICVYVGKDASKQACTRAHGRALASRGPGGDAQGYMAIETELFSTEGNVCQRTVVGILLPSGKYYHSGSEKIVGKVLSDKYYSHNTPSNLAEIIQDLLVRMIADDAFIAR